MADPSIALSVKPPQVRSPLESMDRAVRIADMVATSAQRQQEAAYQKQAAPVRQAALEAQKRQLDEDAAMDEAFKGSVKFNEELGDIEYDQPRGVQILKDKQMGHLLPSYQEQIDKRRAGHRQQVLAEVEQAMKVTEREGQIAENFLALDEAGREEEYLTLRRNLVAMDPSVAQRLPQKYDASVADNLQKVVKQRQQLLSVADRLKEAQSKQELAQIEEDKLDPDALWKKHNPKSTDPTPPWFRNAITARRAGVTAPPASTYARRKITTKPMPGTAIPADAVDIDGMAIPADQRTADAQFEGYENPDGTRYYQQTVGFAKSAKEKENERTERAYAFAVGKPFDSLTPEDRIKADAWKQKMTPERKTILDRKLALFDSDPEKYAKLFPYGQQDIVTADDKRSALTTVQNNIRILGLRGDKAKAYYDERVAEYKGIGIDLPGFAGTTAPAPGPARPTNTPAVKYGPTEERTLKGGGKVKVRQNLSTGKYEEVK